MIKLLTLAAATCALSSGCVLIESPQNFPYNGPVVIITTDTGSPEDIEEEPDVAVDLPGPKPPLLVFTEVLIDSTATWTGLGDRGEYIEIKNIGEGPADPRRVAMQLSDPTADNPVKQRIQVALPVTVEEREVVGNLKPIEPGGYFVFVRFETEQIPVSTVVMPGSSYDFGVYANGPTLADAGPRELELTYDAELSDVVRWQDGQLIAPDGAGDGVAIEPDKALALDVGSEDPQLNDDPKKWCIPPEPFGTGIANGTPGGATDCGF